MRVWKKKGLNYKYKKLPPSPQNLTPHLSFPHGKPPHQSFPSLGGVRGGFGASGGPKKKPPNFTPMAWCFAINQTLSLAAT